MFSDTPRKWGKIIESKENPRIFTFFFLSQATGEACCRVLMYIILWLLTFRTLKKSRIKSYHGTLLCLFLSLNFFLRSLINLVSFCFAFCIRLLGKRTRFSWAELRFKNWALTNGGISPLGRDLCLKALPTWNEND